MADRCIVGRLLTYRAPITQACISAVIGPIPLHPQYISVVGVCGQVGGIDIRPAPLRILPTSIDLLVVGNVAVADKPYIPNNQSDKRECVVVKLSPVKPAINHVCPVTAAVPPVAQWLIVGGVNQGHYFGIPSLESSINKQLLLGGMDTMSIGVPSVDPGGTRIIVSSIYPPAPDVGAPYVFLKQQWIKPSGILSSAACGAPTITKKHQFILVDGGDCGAVGTISIVNEDQALSLVGSDNSTVSSVALVKRTQELYPTSLDTLSLGSVILRDNFTHVVVSSIPDTAVIGNVVLYNLTQTIYPIGGSMLWVGAPTLSNRRGYIFTQGVDSATVSPIITRLSNTIFPVGGDTVSVSPPAIHNVRQYVYMDGMPPSNVFGVPSLVSTRQFISPPGIDVNSTSGLVRIYTITRPTIGGVDTLCMGDVSLRNYLSYIYPANAATGAVVGSPTLHNKHQFIIGITIADALALGEPTLYNSDQYINLVGSDTSIVGVLDVRLRDQHIKPSSIVGNTVAGACAVENKNRRIVLAGIPPIGRDGNTLPLSIVEYTQVIYLTGENHLNTTYNPYSIPPSYERGSSGIATFSPWTVKLVGIEPPPAFATANGGGYISETESNVGKIQIYPAQSQLITPSPAIELDPLNDLYTDPKKAIGLEWAKVDGVWQWRVVYEGVLVRVDAISPVTLYQNPPNIFTQRIQPDCADAVGTVVMYVDLLGGDTRDRYTTQRISPDGGDTAIVAQSSTDYGTIEVDPLDGHVFVKPLSNDDIESMIAAGYRGIKYPIVSSTGFVQRTSVDNCIAGIPILHLRTQVVLPKGFRTYHNPELLSRLQELFARGQRMPNDYIEWRDVNGVYQWDYASETLLANEPNYYPSGRLDAQFGIPSLSPKRILPTGFSSQRVGVPIVCHFIQTIVLSGIRPLDEYDSLFGISEFSVHNVIDGLPHIIYVDYGIAPHPTNDFEFIPRPPAVVKVDQDSDNSKIGYIGVRSI